MAHIKLLKSPFLSHILPLIHPDFLFQVARLAGTFAELSITCDGDGSDDVM
jgi:hypothetical protein